LLKREAKGDFYFASSAAGSGDIDIDLTTRLANMRKAAGRVVMGRERT